MEIILVRHAKALDKIKALLRGVNDEDRPLTRKGKEKFFEFIKANRGHFVGCDYFASSTYLRSKQTLEIILEVLQKDESKLNLINKITPEDSPLNLRKWFQNTQYKKVVIVTHEPLISNFLTLVLGKNWDSETKIKKGSLVRLKYANSKFSFMSYLAP